MVFVSKLTKALYTSASQPPLLKEGNARNWGQALGKLERGFAHLEVA